MRLRNACFLFLLLCLTACAQGSVERASSTPSILAPRVTLVPTDTQVPPALSTDTPTNTPVPDISNAIIQRLPKEPLILYVENSSYYLQNILTGETWLVFESETSPIEIYRFLGWSREGCEMLIWGEKILRLNLQGEVLEEIHAFDEEKIIVDLAITNQEDKIAYLSGSTNPQTGGYGIDSLEIVDLERSLRTFQYQFVTTGPAGDSIAWSPDGEWLSYAERDYEQNKVFLYIRRQDGTERRQVAEIEGESLDITDVNWSPDGKWIAFIYGETGLSERQYSIDNPHVVVASVEPDHAPIDLTDILNIRWICSLWWQSNSILVLNGDDHYRIDITTMQIVDTVSGSETPEKFFNRPYTLDGLGLIGFTTDLFRLYIYDSEEQVIYLVPNAHWPFPGRWNMIPIPPSFPGVNACQP